MHQDTTLYGGRPQPSQLCIRWRPAPPLPPKRGRNPSSFCLRLLWPNGCMDQDAIWYRGRSRPTRHCVRRGPRSPPPNGGGAPKFSAHVYCGQTAAWIKMVLCMEVGLSPGDFVLDGDPAPSAKRGKNPRIFGPCLLRPNGCMDQDATRYGGRSRPTRHCVR